MSNKHQHTGYYLPAPSAWPVIGSLGLFCMVVGGANWLHGALWGRTLLMVGSAILIIMMVGWFGTVMRENRRGLLSDKQVDRSFRWSMCWFIFTEVMFFGAFFGALFYVRLFSVPWLGGETPNHLTHLVLWPHFHAVWPLFSNPNPNAFIGPKAVMETWGLPAFNTLVLLTSGATMTWAHWGLLHNNRRAAVWGQAATIALGILFLSMQAHEYGMAYTEKGLMLGSGIYGTTFFMLTGFHAFHVTIGTICLIVIFYRILRKDFDAHNHFAFEAVSWYWHFVDVVWLLLFVIVYWL